VRRLASASAAIAVLALGCASSMRFRPLSATLPVGLPSAAERATWERIDGDYDTEHEHVRYSLFVDPERPMLFRITHYRVSARRPAGSRPRFEDGAETVVWNETPGRRVPLHCFAEERREGAASTPAVPSWRSVSPATPEFQLSMYRAMEIYGRVRREGRAGPPVG
jgi:transposase